MRNCSTLVTSRIQTAERDMAIGPIAAVCLSPRKRTHGMRGWGNNGLGAAE